MIIAVDFDGTIVENRYPDIGRERPFAIETLRLLIRDKHQLILWTVREGQSLDEAVQWCHTRGLDFYAVNKNFPEENMEKLEHCPRKINADLFIDDKAIAGLPDWGQIYQIITTHTSYEHLLRQQMTQHLDAYTPPRRKHWWHRFK